jgi:hypothetical protein
MLTSVTQDLTVRIVPVNNPHLENKWGEQMGGYRAYVSAGTDAVKLIEQGQHEIHRGIVPMTIGYGSSASARIAALNAIDDYADKFGALATADTNNF